MELLGRLWREEDGQDLAEYGIALAVIAGSVAVIVLGLGDDIFQLWGTAAKRIRQALAGG
jgi:Flp pilus assembly pilin Flp